MEAITILIVDDHTLFRQGLRKLLEAYPDIQIVGEASNGKQALAEVQRLNPSLILMDIKMPGMDGIEAVELIRKSYPNAKIVALSMYDDTEYVLKAIKVGACGYIHKNISADRLIETIKQIHSQEKSLIHLAVGAEVIKEAEPLLSPKLKGLTEQERKILKLMAEGKTNREIARRLYLSEQTVKGYVRNILAKLGALHRTQAVAIALREGIVS